MAAPKKTTAKSTTKAKAAPKKAATAKRTPAKAAKAAPAEAKVQLTPDEVARRQRKALFMGLVEQGMPVPFALQQEFAPAIEGSAPAAPVAAAPVAPQQAEAFDPYDADAGETVLKARIIRNLRSVHVNLRLDGGGEKPFRVSLKPRGQMGDTVRVPAKCTDDVSFTGSLSKGLFEIITPAEMRSIDYTQTADTRSYAEKMGILDWQGNPVQVAGGVQQQQFVSRTEIAGPTEHDNRAQMHAVEQQMGREQVQDWRAQHAQVTPIGPNIVSMPGSDPQLTAQFQQQRAEASVPQGYAPVLQQGVGRPLETVQHHLRPNPTAMPLNPTGKGDGSSAMPLPGTEGFVAGVAPVVQHFDSGVPAGTPSRQVVAPQG